MNNHNLLKLFVVYMRDERQMAKNTIEAYTHDVKVLLESMKKAHKSIRSLKYQDFISFLEPLRIRLEATSICRAIFAWKTFFRCLRVNEKLNLRVWKIVKALDVPKCWQKVPVMMSWPELKQFLDGIETNTHKGMLMKVILEFLYGSGVRVSEMCEIKLKDVDLRQRYVQVTHGKGGRQRNVVIGKFHVRLLKEYWNRFRPNIGPDDYIIVGVRGKKLDRTRVYRIVKASVRQYHISKDISPVTMRHCFATHMLENGAPLVIIQSLLGHRSILSTDRYIHFGVEFLRKEFKRCHPYF